MLIESGAEITCQPDIVELIAVVESVNSLSASHVASNRILILFQRVTRYVFKMLTDELRLLSHCCLPWIRILAVCSQIGGYFAELLEGGLEIFDVLTRQGQGLRPFQPLSHVALTPPYSQDIHVRMLQV